MPFGLGTTEIILILIIVVILILMPTKLPQFARSIGESVKEFRRASKEISEKDISAIKNYEKQIVSQEKKEELDEETIEKLANKLGISKEGKTKEELINEIIQKAKEKGLI